MSQRLPATGSPECSLEDSARTGGAELSRAAFQGALPTAACRPRLRSGALHLCPVTLLQDVLQQPIDHVQSLVPLQHDVIRVHVALPPLLHLPGEQRAQSPSTLPSALPAVTHQGLGRSTFKLRLPKRSSELPGPVLWRHTWLWVQVATINPWVSVKRTVPRIKRQKTRCYL